MEYVPGAGRNTSKNCIPGTWEDILSEIKCWIRSTGEDVPRVLWLSGTAGKGKSAIAHTIAKTAQGSPLQGYTDWVWSVAISPDGKHIVSGSDDKTILVWNMETCKQFSAPLRGHTGWVQCVAISPDGKRIVSGSSDGEAMPTSMDCDGIQLVHKQLTGSLGVSSCSSAISLS
jgi:WD40 repeat protein